MPKKIALSSLNANSYDVLNALRQTLSAQYQSMIPMAKNQHDLIQIGDVLYGYPAIANEFSSALIGRVAFEAIKSAAFNNRWVALKKGYITTGEMVEEVFVEMAKAREFSLDKANAREHKLYVPDVRAAFHPINYKLLYPVSVSPEDLRAAFTSEAGVTNLITRIIDAVVTGAEYDEFLIMKYTIIKAIVKGAMHAEAVSGATPADMAKAFRAFSSAMEFPSDKYNVAGVHPATPKEDQYLIMDVMTNAEYDVDVLSAAFNMDRATFAGHQLLVDDWTTFDSDRFAAIVANTDKFEPITDEELDLMATVKAVLIDKEFMQVYDTLSAMRVQQTASGLYDNYFYHAWKIVSYSPFSNAIVFVEEGE